MRRVLKKILSPLLQKASAIYLSKPRVYKFHDIKVVVMPTVFPPFITISTKILLEFTEKLHLNGKTLLELGCGCGIISILAAKKGASVTATDINEVAVSALETNAQKNHVTLEAIYSDLFSNLTGRSFDYIIINPPYYPKNPSSIAETAWFCGEDFEYFRMLFQQIPPFISDQNYVFMILSVDCNVENIKQIASATHILLEETETVTVAAEKNFIFRLTR